MKLTFSVLLLLWVLSGEQPLLGESCWPQFRGSNGQGVAEGKPPVEFGPTTNLLWQTALPTGHSSPCIWGDRIFLTALEGQKLKTICLQRGTGKILWSSLAPAEQIEKSHPTGSPAASTPTTDGRNVYVYFGSFGLLCYDFKGKEIWHKPLPMPVTGYGSGSSPVVVGKRLLLNCDQDGGSFLLAVDSRSGKTLWKTGRPGFVRGFATPLVLPQGENGEVIMAGNNRVMAYELKDGSEKWSARGLPGYDVCPTPVAGEGLVFVAGLGNPALPGSITLPAFAEYSAANDKNKDGKISLDEMPSGPLKSNFGILDPNRDGAITADEWEASAKNFARGENSLFAVRPGGHGDVTDSQVVWKQKRGVPRISSPLFYHERIYVVKDGGILSCFNAKDGTPVWQEERVGAEGDYYASPVAANGRVYVASKRGVVAVIEAGETLKVIARNNLGEEIMATPAIVEDTFYVRTAKHLYAFGQPKR